MLGYLLGYIMSLTYQGIPNVYYIIPIKVTAFVFAITIGTTLYYAIVERVLIFQIPIRIMKYVILCIVIIGFSIYLQEYLFYNYGIDITPFLGIP